MRSCQGNFFPASNALDGIISRASVPAREKISLAGTHTLRSVSAREIGVYNRVRPAEEWAK